MKWNNEWKTSVTNLFLFHFFCCCFTVTAWLSNFLLNHMPLSKDCQPGISTMPARTMMGFCGLQPVMDYQNMTDSGLPTSTWRMGFHTSFTEKLKQMPGAYYGPCPIIYLILLFSRMETGGGKLTRPPRRIAVTWWTRSMFYTKTTNRLFVWEVITGISSGKTTNGHIFVFRVTPR